MLIHCELPSCQTTTTPERTWKLALDIARALKNSAGFAFHPFFPTSTQNVRPALDHSSSSAHKRRKRCRAFDVHRWERWRKKKKLSFFLVLQFEFSAISSLASSNTDQPTSSSSSHTAVIVTRQKYNEDLIMIFNWNWKFSLLACRSLFFLSCLLLPAVHLSSSTAAKVGDKLSWRRRRLSSVAKKKSSLRHNEMKTIVGAR